MDGKDVVPCLKELLAARPAVSQLPPQQQAEVQQLVLQYGHSLGLFHPMPVPVPVPFGVQVTFTQQPSQFSLKFAASFRKQLAACGSLEEMLNQWEGNIRAAFDPSLRVLQILEGSVVAVCESRVPLLHLAYRALEVMVNKPASLSSLEGFAPGPVRDSPSKITWLSQTKLQKALVAAPYVPEGLPRLLLQPAQVDKHDQPSETSSSSMSSSNGSQQSASEQPSQLDHDGSVPLTREDFLAIAQEFDDLRTVERIQKDPTYRPWIFENA